MLMADPVCVRWGKCQNTPSFDDQLIFMVKFTLTITINAPTKLLMIGVDGRSNGTLKDYCIPNNELPCI